MFIMYSETIWRGEGHRLGYRNASPDNADARFERGITTPSSRVAAPSVAPKPCWCYAPTMFSEYTRVLRNYAVFDGRANRAEFWFFALAQVFIGVAASILSAAIHGWISLAWFLYLLAMLLPSLAVCVRRLHDTGRSAWWLLVGTAPSLIAIPIMVTGVYLFAVSIVGGLLGGPGHWNSRSHQRRQWFGRVHRRVIRGILPVGSRADWSWYSRNDRRSGIRDHLDRLLGKSR